MGNNKKRVCITAMPPYVRRTKGSNENDPKEPSARNLFELIVGCALQRT